MGKKREKGSLVKITYSYLFIVDLLTLLNVYKMFAIYFIKIFWSGGFKSGIKIFDFRKFKVVEDFLNFKFASLHPPSWIWKGFIAALIFVMQKIPENKVWKKYKIFWGEIYCFFCIYWKKNDKTWGIFF